MSLDDFASSKAFTLGVELELQIVNRHDYDLAPGAADLLRLTSRRKLAADVKPEITSSMIELSTGICERHHDVITQLLEVRDALVHDAAKLNLRLCGGGTHAFQDWSRRRIFDTPRFRQVSELYGYLSKQFTVFGQHVHIGCTGPDQALWLLHAMSRFVPHVIALSASSPFVQGTDTGFQSARLNSVFAFPLSGRAPFALTWQEFGVYFDKMRRTGVVESMKDFYWDIRPKPEFGTIEVRVMDTPLTVERAAAIAAYLQCVARWLVAGKALRAARGRLPGLHLQPLPGLPLRPRRRSRRPAHRRAPAAARPDRADDQGCGVARHRAARRARPDAAARGADGRRRQRCGVAAQRAGKRAVPARSGAPAVPALRGR